MLAEQFPSLGLCSRRGGSSDWAQQVALLECLFLLSKSAWAAVAQKMRGFVWRKFIVPVALLSFISDKQTFPALLGSMSEGIYWEVVWVWSGICFDISVQIHVMAHWLIQLKIGGDIKPRILYRFFPPFSCLASCSSKIFRSLFKSVLRLKLQIASLLTHWWITLEQILVLLNSLRVALVISLFGKSHVMLELSTCLNKRFLKYVQESLHVRFI